MSAPIRNPVASERKRRGGAGAGAHRDRKNDYRRQPKHRKGGDE